MDDYKFSINLSSSKFGNLVKSFPLFSISEKLKKGFKEEVELRDGLKLIVNEYKLKKNISVDFTIENAPLEFAFCLSGKMNIEINQSSGFKSFLEISSGNCAVFCLPHTSGTMRISGCEQLKVLSLHVSKDYLKQFVYQEISDFPKILSDAIWSEDSNPFILTSKMNPLMTMSGNQILENVFSGTPRKMFLEAKALELMTHIISQISDDYSEKSTNQLSSEEIEKIEKLEQNLIQNFANLPSLAEMAESLAMTHTRLNQAFRKVFGNTVFGYIREKRLEEAKAMLEKGLTVTEITYKLGFSSPAHLSRDFREKFGINPKAYQKSIK